MTGINEMMSRDPIPSLPEVKDRVKLRRAYGITQQGLANALGVSRLTVIAWEHGTSEPAGENRERYSAVLAEWARKLAS